MMSTTNVTVIHLPTVARWNYEKIPIYELDAWNSAATQSMAYRHSVHQSLAPQIRR